MPSSARTQLLIDPNDLPTIEVCMVASLGGDVSTHVHLDGPDTSLIFQHWRGFHEPGDFSPAASITWLRSVADAIEVAWAQRRLAESQPELTEVAS